MNNFPSHIAFILDGNQRWEKKSNLEKGQGHLKGVETLISILNYLATTGISTVTIYAFSSENWLRPPKEVEFLLNLLKEFFTSQKKVILEKGAKVKIIGDTSKFSQEIKELILEIEKDSERNTNFLFQIALNYGGRDEIIRAVNQILKEKKQVISEKDFNHYLDTVDNFPDLLIRTGGDFRISNFLLYQIAYTELFFTETYWPDFSIAELEKIILEYQQRERRFGSRKNEI